MRHPSVASTAVALVFLVGVLGLGPVRSGRSQESSPEASGATPDAAPPDNPCMPIVGPGAAPVLDGVIYEFVASHGYTFQGQAVELSAVHAVFATDGILGGCFTGQTVIEVEHGSFTLNVPAAECGRVLIVRADGTSGSTGDPCGIPADTDVPLEAGDNVVLDYSRVTITNVGDTPGALLLASLADDDSGCANLPCP